MNYRDKPQLRDRLAAEYALGTLKGGARRRFETWLAQDRALRRLVADWHERLVPMAQFAPAQTPPERVWTGIERRLGLARPAPAWQFWRHGPAGWWRGATLASSALALVLAVGLAGRLDQPEIRQVASLTDARAEVALTVSADVRHDRLTVRTADGVVVPSDRTLHLWAITAAGQTRSLAILHDNRSAQAPLDARAIGADVAMLAISLEPKGGSPNPDAPTGPVLYKGRWVAL